MVALATSDVSNVPAEFKPLLAAMADAPGEETNLLVFADWLDEHARPALATAVREQAPRVLKRYTLAAACHDALLALDLDGAGRVTMPAPDRGRHRSRRQWCGIVSRALRPFKLSGLSVAVAPGRRSGADIEFRLPPANLFVGTDDNEGFIVPWGITSADLLAIGVLVFSELMPRLFPEEGPRTAHADGISYDTSFWRVVIRHAG